MNKNSSLSSFATKIYVFGWFFLALAIPFSEFLTSLGFIFIGVGWILEWNWKEKWELFKSEKKGLISISLIYFVFLFGLLYSSNIDYALHDLNKKLPLFFLPLIYSTGKRFSKKQILYVFNALGIAAILATVTGLVNLYILEKEEVVLDRRYISPFVDLIRVSIILVFYWFVAFYQLLKSSNRLRWIYLLPLIYIPCVFFIAQSLTGIVCLIIVLIIISVWKFFKINKTLTFFLLGVIISVFIYTLNSIVEASKIINKPVYSSSIDFSKKTLNNREYAPVIDTLFIENGHFIYAYINEYELKREWNSLSKTQYNDSVKGYELKYTILRYLTSKGLTKDSLGVHQLTQEEIDAIGKGVANVYYFENNAFKSRIFSTLWELKEKEHADYSLTGRIVLWKMGYDIFKEHPLFGCGTGDVKDKFKKLHETKYSHVQDKRKRRTHNQYFTVLLSLGVFGFLIFMYAFSYPVFLHKNDLHFFTVCFFIVYALTMLWEDSLETQAGSMIYAIINTLLFFKSKEN